MIYRGRKREKKTNKFLYVNYLEIPDSSVIRTYEEEREKDEILINSETENLMKDQYAFAWLITHIN